jgi:hypothetical protein
MVSNDLDPTDVESILAHLRTLAAAGQLRLSLHASKKLAQEAYTVDDIITAIANSTLRENYPPYHIGPCCLLSGQTAIGRAIHIVCSTTTPMVTIELVEEVLAIGAERGEDPRRPADVPDTPGEQRLDPRPLVVPPPVPPHHHVPLDRYPRARPPTLP